MAKLEMLLNLNPSGLHCLAPSSISKLRHRNLAKLKATIFGSHSDEIGELNQSVCKGVSKPVPRSSRGRTRKSLGLDEAQPSSFQRAQETLSDSFVLAERKGYANLSLSTKPQNDAGVLLQKLKNKSCTHEGSMAGIAKYFEGKSRVDGPNTSKPAVESSEHHIPDMANSKELPKRIQDLINADLEHRYKSDSEDIDEKDPLFVEEDDPYWLDEPDEGWGFKVSNIFKEKFGVAEGKKRKEKDDDDVSDVPEIDWDFQPEKWSAQDVDSMSWSDTVFGNPSPLVVLVYERYGKKGRECYHVLRELEEAANRIWDCKRLPPRLAKVNVLFEEDLTAAIGIKEAPTVLFIKGGKMIHHQSGYFTADDLLRIISYFYHGAARPPCLKNYKPSSKH